LTRVAARAHGRVRCPSSGQHGYGIATAGDSRRTVLRRVLPGHSTTINAAPLNAGVFADPSQPSAPTEVAERMIVFTPVAYPLLVPPTSGVLPELVRHNRVAYSDQLEHSERSRSAAVA